MTHLKGRCGQLGSIWVTGVVPPHPHPRERSWPSSPPGSRLWPLLRTLSTRSTQGAIPEVGHLLGTTTSRVGKSGNLGTRFLVHFQSKF